MTFISAGSLCPWQSVSASQQMAGDMRRAIIRNYGDMSDPKVLEVEFAPPPTPGPDEVLVRVKAVGLNPIDFKIAAGNLQVVAPLPVYPGTDCSGIVEEIGSQVTRFRVGDSVMGNGFGCLSEFVSMKEDRVSVKPGDWSFEKAAALPTAGVTARVLVDAAMELVGKEVVIVGASGGVGCIAVQLAKTAGAKVYAVCSGKNADFVKKLGADEVLDYTQGDWTARFRGQSDAPSYIWDVSPTGGISVWESVCNWLPASSKVISINTFDPSFKLTIGDALNQFFWFPATNRISNMVGNQPSYRFVDANQAPNFREALERLKEAADNNRLDIPSVESYKLGDVHSAVAKLMSGHVRGKVVVVV